MKKTAISTQKSGENLTAIYSNLEGLTNDFRNQNLNNLLVSLLRGKSVLDIGCGAGHFLFRAQNSGFEVQGLEPEEGLVDLSQKLYRKKIPVRQASIDIVPSLSKTFDNIVMIDVLEHIDDDRKAMRDVAKKLSQEGQFVIVVPAYQALFSTRDQEIGHFRRYSAEDLREKLEQNGFEIIQMRSWNLLGVVPYYIFNTLLNKSLSTQMRSGNPKSSLKKLIQKVLFVWFKHIENSMNFGVGLSIICVAKLRRQ